MPAIKNAHIRYRIIDNCIRSKYRPYPSKEDLRRMCEESLFNTDSGDRISISTIEKDLFAMRMDMDAPIRYSKREDGYYYEDTSFSINDIPLSDEELESLKFASKTLLQFKDTAMFQQFGFAIEKIFDRINTSKEVASEESEIIQFERGFSSKGNQFLPDLLAAIKNKLIVHFGYESFQSGIYKDRTVLPLLLKEYRNRWYLISHDFDKGTEITYALERMEQLKVSTDIYDKEINFSAKDFFKYATGITTSNQKPVEIIFTASKIASKYIESQPFHSSQKRIETSPQSDTFYIKVLISEELIRNFMSFGGEIKIIQPSSLLTTIKTRLNTALDNYR